MKTEFEKKLKIAAKRLARKKTWLKMLGEMQPYAKTKEEAEALIEQARKDAVAEMADLAHRKKENDKI